MGDRANIYLEMPKSYGPEAEVGGIYLYTHWSGYVWPERLREALKFGRPRWNDEQYLARIIISRVYSDVIDSETGGGIGLTIGDNEHLITVVDVLNREVSFAHEGSEADPKQRFAKMSFAEFVAQERAEYPER